MNRVFSQQIFHVGIWAILVCSLVGWMLAVAANVLLAGRFVSPFRSRRCSSRGTTMFERFRLYREARSKITIEDIRFPRWLPSVGAPLYSRRWPYVSQNTRIDAGARVSPLCTRVSTFPATPPAPRIYLPLLHSRFVYPFRKS